MFDLKNFTSSRLRNAWVSPCAHMYVHVTKSQQYHPLTKRPLKCFSVANVTVDDTVRNTGIFSAWIASVTQEAKALGYDAVQVECVITNRFANYFRDRGWIETSQSTPSFFRILTE